MKKLVLLSSIICVLFAVSCKKDKQETNKERIVGTWKVNYGGEDANGNGTMDGSEKIISTDFKNNITINENGTATIVYQRSSSDPMETSNYNYSLNGDQSIVTMSSTTGVTAAYTILSLDGSSMLWSYQPAGTNKKWIGMSK